jgi:nucleoid DNA-binding protein
MIHPGLQAVVIWIYIQSANNDNVLVFHNNRLEFRDFGDFKPSTRTAETGQNPKTMEKIQVSAKRRGKFKMGRIMKQRLDGHI